MKISTLLTFLYVALTKMACILRVALSKFVAGMKPRTINHGIFIELGGVGGVGGVGSGAVSAIFLEGLGG